MTSIWEKAISILAGNLNSGRSYLITAVIETKDLLGLCYSLLKKNLAETYSELVLYVYKKI